MKGVPKALGGTRHKMKVLSLVDRSSGHSRSFVVDDVKLKTVLPIILANVAKEAICVTDDAGIYVNLNKHGFHHGVVNHGQDEVGARARAHEHDRRLLRHLQTGLQGIYQHCAEKHLHRYMAEFDFRYSYRASTGFDDGARAAQALKGILGKRLTYGTAS